MAHKLLEESIKENKQKKYTFSFPRFEGKFGVSCYVGSKEIFFGIGITHVTMETVTRSRKIKTQPGTVQVLRLEDPTT